jgi:hypothetical protein
MIVLAGYYTPWDVRMQHSSDRAGLGRELAFAVSEATGLLGLQMGFEVLGWGGERVVLLREWAF